MLVRMGREPRRHHRPDRRARPASRDQRRLNNAPKTIQIVLPSGEPRHPHRRDHHPYRAGDRSAPQLAGRLPGHGAEQPGGGLGPDQCRLSHGCRFQASPASLPCAGRQRDIWVQRKEERTWLIHSEPLPRSGSMLFFIVTSTSYAEQSCPV